MQKLFKSFSKIIETPFFVLEEAKSDSQQNPHPYYRMTGNNSVIALILDEEDNFIMVTNYFPKIDTPEGVDQHGCINKNSDDSDITQLGKNITKAKAYNKILHSTDGWKIFKWKPK